MSPPARGEYPCKLCPHVAKSPGALGGHMSAHRLRGEIPPEPERPCVFCGIIEGCVPCTLVQRWHDAIAIVPLDPVTEGHVLVIPRLHVVDALDRPRVTARTMQRAAEIARPDCNLITSVGPLATQTVFHLHVHVVPRVAGDGLVLPWGTAPAVS